LHAIDNLAKRVIKPTLEANGLRWYGWHAYRRALATNLDELDVPLNTIQAILRHSDSRTTQLYIKRVPKTVRREMGKLEKSIAKRRK
jgi:integrase